MAKSKQSTLLAKIEALENASEFIGGHGESGGIDEETFDDFSLNQYLKQCKQIADKLQKMADRLKSQID